MDTKHDLMPYLSNFAGQLSLCFYAAERSRTLTLWIVIDASASFYIVEGQRAPIDACYVP